MQLLAVTSCAYRRDRSNVARTRLQRIQGEVFMWIELLSAVNTPRLKDFFTKVMDSWLAVTLKVR